MTPTRHPCLDLCADMVISLLILYRVLPRNDVIQNDLGDLYTWAAKISVDNVFFKKKIHICIVSNIYTNSKRNLVRNMVSSTYQVQEGKHLQNLCFQA